MKDNKVFIALKNFEQPNHLAEYGVHLAKRLGKEAFLYGLTKVPLYTPPATMQRVGMESALIDSMDTIKEKKEDKLRTVYNEALKIHSKISYSIEVGFAEPSIIAKVEDEVPHMVVVEGNNELTTLHEWFGTYETRLAENIDVPVLVVPENHQWKSVDKILYVMDMDDQKIENVRFLTEVATELNATLSIVVIDSEPYSAHEHKKYQLTKDVLINLLGYSNIEFHRIVKEESAEVVENLMNQVDADWLVFEHRSRSFIERMMDDYNTKRLILQAEIPVLVF